MSVLQREWRMLDYIYTKMEYNGKPFYIAALFCDGEAEELMADSADSHSRVGCIYRGVTERILRGTGGVFVRIGRETAYLPTRTSVLTGEWSNASCPCLVQIRKDPAGLKEAVVTEDLSLTGKYAVVFLKKGAPAFSAKLADERKECIKKWLRDEDIGTRQIIIRTNAASCEKADLIAEIRSLTEKLEGILEASKSASLGKLLYQPDPYYVTLLRDLKVVPDRCITDIPTAVTALKEVSGDCVFRERPGTQMTLAEAYNLPHLLDRLSRRVVWLKNGAFLVIEQTEAFVSVDVNTGKCARGRIPEETYRAVNLVAAEELARQLRLRNLSGIILVDFLKIEREEHKEELFNVMKKLLRRDRVKCEAVDLTPLGIMEIIRQKQQKPLAEVLSV